MEPEISQHTQKSDSISSRLLLLVFFAEHVLFELRGLQAERVEF